MIEYLNLTILIILLIQQTLTKEVQWKAAVVIRDRITKDRIINPDKIGKITLMPGLETSQVYYTSIHI